MTKISITQNSFGHLHIFKGIPKLCFSNPKNITKEDKTESELYIQEDMNIIDIKQNLSKRQVKDLENGYRVIINDIGFFETENFIENWDKTIKELAKRR